MTPHWVCPSPQRTIPTYVFKEERTRFCCPGRGLQNMRYTSQAIEWLGFIVKIFKSSQRESHAFLHSTILGLGRAAEALILQLRSMSSSERGGALAGKGSGPSDFPTCPPSTASHTHTDTEQWGGGTRPGTGPTGSRGQSCAPGRVTWQR